MLLQEFGETDDGVQGGAEFVAHIRQELALHLIGASRSRFLPPIPPDAPQLAENVWRLVY